MMSCYALRMQLSLASAIHTIHSVFLPVSTISTTKYLYIYKATCSLLVMLHLIPFKFATVSKLPRLSSTKPSILHLHIASAALSICFYCMIHKSLIIQIYSSLFLISLFISPAPIILERELKIRDICSQFLVLKIWFVFLPISSKDDALYLRFVLQFQAKSMIEYFIFFLYKKSFPIDEFVLLGCMICEGIPFVWR